MPSYRALGQTHELQLFPLDQPAGVSAFAAVGMAKMGARSLAHTAPSDASVIARAVSASPVLRSRVVDTSRLAIVQGRVPVGRSSAAARSSEAPMSSYDAVTLVTETVIAEGLRQADLTAATAFGARVVDEGLDGKVLLQVESVDKVFGLVELLLKREVGSVSPNFLRRIVPVRPSAPANAWSHAKIGVQAAWAVTRGKADIKVAILDEGVDTTHPALKPAVVAERDFIGHNGASAMPDGNDAHGTACAGIAVSRDNGFPGVAPGCSLIAARIAKDDGEGGWVFEDYSTADAVDWCWREGAAILSNSWGGGAPSDAISRAFARARTQGRGGLGSVVVIAAGNSQTPIDFPGSLPGYVTVGASNHVDERKTRTSADGEPWGSNFGATMHLLAPGVFIWATDIVGPAGYDPGNFTKTFNGTSSATPAVAGAVALMLSANPSLSTSNIRDILAKTAKKLAGQTTWTPELGWGRLDVGRAVAEAKAFGSGKPPKPPKKAKVKKTKKKTNKKKAKKAKKAGKSKK